MNDIIFDLIRLKGKGYCCAQIIVMLGLEAQGKQNPELVRAVGGLCFGIGWSGEMCGALSGGAALLSLHGGKGQDGEEPHELYPTMMSELVTWFADVAEEAYGGRRCSEILERCPDRSVCGLIVADTYSRCMDILVGHGFDPGAGRG
ncbi:C-GCAxxG-C-C family protein [Geobacter hydrogenophilus]|uniref:Redox-active protein n=1 Tax=Geobacter hydrogenophilus TaxID=40983 RepID=A0A9W6G2Y6_9BACT|nr:DV_1555 family C-GCAxxG-C-C protein [Geobacter hydrogenophilus]MBT0894430.1 C-GCAxxG-C-C family protein [Geobacter hydrogenophilus]GLI39414.1 hypothetical protein GHYDROH2_29150 [Geobacter hydrogenophilus]